MYNKNMSRQEALAAARQNLAACKAALEATRAACAMLQATGGFENGANAALVALTAQVKTAECYLVDAEYKAGAITADEFYAKMDAIHNDGLRAAG
jgi:hypothetical protein